MSTYVNVFLPLAYPMLTSEEFSKKECSPLVMEAAIFIGAAAQHLGWSQYLNVIKFLLRQLDLHIAQRERFLLQAMCSVLDSFHFDTSLSAEELLQIQGANATIGEIEIELEDEYNSGTLIAETNQKNAVVEGVLNTVIPWVRVFLLKDVKDHKGSESKTVRPLVAVALVKLISKLQAPLVSDERKEAFLDNLILNVVSVLKSRDSDARDAARESLGKMVQTYGMRLLRRVLFELDKSMKEGYQRHVRNYTIRSLLADCTQNYTPPVDSPRLSLESDKSNFHLPHVSFDDCIPLIVSSAIEDMVGATSVDRVTDGAIRTLIREAKGSKSNEILELTARHILFRPSYALICPQNPASTSSVHALVTPLLELLISRSDKAIIGRVSQALQYIAQGLSKNPSLVDREALLYIFSTLSPLIASLLGENGLSMEEAIPSYFQNDDDIEILGNQRENSKKMQMNTTWLPREALRDQRAAIKEREKARLELTRVQDGFSAPKLTGADRHKRGRDFNALNKIDGSPASLAAIKFCLSLLHACLKQHHFEKKDEELVRMVSPFLKLLLTCLQIRGAADVVASTMRCLSLLLSLDDVAVDEVYAKALGSEIIQLMFRGGALITTDNDLVQACLKGLTSLFKLSKNDGASLPLSTGQIRELLHMLTASVLDLGSAYQSAAFQLIRTIVELKIVVPEVYDIVSKLCDQLVLSHRKATRETSASIIRGFILYFPLGENKMAAILRRLITNCSYEFKDGRLASIRLLQSLSGVLPVPLLDANAQLVFLPMTLLLVNESSSECREAAGDVITTILRRVSQDIANIFAEYCMRWLEQAASFGASGRVALDSESPCRALVRTAAQVTALIVSNRSECIKRLGYTSSILNECFNFLSAIVIDSFHDKSHMEDQEESKETENAEGLSDWAIAYHLLLALDLLQFHLPFQADAVVGSETSLHAIQEAILYPHSWVRAAALRLLQRYLSSKDATVSTSCRLLSIPNSIYHLARRLCAAMNQNFLAASILDPLLSCLLFATRAMHYSQRNIATAKLNLDCSIDEFEEDDEAFGGETYVTLKSSGAFWVIRRLCGVASSSGGARRENVLKVFSLLSKRDFCLANEVLMVICSSFRR